MRWPLICLDREHRSFCEAGLRQPQIRAATGRKRVKGPNYKFHANPLWRTNPLPCRVRTPANTVGNGIFKRSHELNVARRIACARGFFMGLCGHRPMLIPFRRSSEPASVYYLDCPEQKNVASSLEPDSAASARLSSCSVPASAISLFSTRRLNQVGTWRDNIYPVALADVPVLCTSFFFAPSLQLAHAFRAWPKCRKTSAS